MQQPGVGSLFEYCNTAKNKSGFTNFHEITQRTNARHHQRKQTDERNYS